MVEFAVVDLYSQIGSYLQYDLGNALVADGTVDSRSWSWTAAEGGLVLEMENMPLVTYLAAPISRKKIALDTKGTVSRVELNLGDKDGSITADAAENVANLRGATIVVRRTHAALDKNDVNSYRTLFRGKVTNFSVDQGPNLSIEVSECYFGWSRTFSKRNYCKLCGFRFKGTRCGYTGPGVFCDKTMTQCTAYGNDSRFGGFPYTAKLQFRRVRIF